MSLRDVVDWVVCMREEWGGGEKVFASAIL